MNKLPDPKKDTTFIEQMNELGEKGARIILAIDDMPDELNDTLLDERREHIADIFESIELEREEIKERLKHHESKFLDIYDESGEHLCETVMRMEAQDVVVQSIYDKFKEEDII